MILKKQTSMSMASYLILKDANKMVN